MIGGNAEKKTWFDNIIKEKKHQIHHISKNEFLKKYPSKRTQGIVVHFSGKVIQNISSFNKTNNNECLLVVDSLEDPQNLGQIIGTCECAGFDGIIFRGN